MLDRKDVGHFFLGRFSKLCTCLVSHTTWALYLDHLPYSMKHSEHSVSSVPEIDFFVLKHTLVISVADPFCQQILDAYE